MSKITGRGGAGRGQGRKAKWYGKTVAMRVPEIWAEKIQACMNNKTTPIFDTVQNKNDSVQKQNKPVKRRKKVYSEKMIALALELYSQGKNGAEVWNELVKTGFEPPSKSHMKRWLEGCKKQNL